MDRIITTEMWETTFAKLNAELDEFFAEHPWGCCDWWEGGWRDYAVGARILYHKGDRSIELFDVMNDLLGRNPFTERVRNWARKQDSSLWSVNYN